MEAWNNPVFPNSSNRGTQKTNKYRALEPVDYDRLVLNKPVQQSPVNEPATLACQACRAITVYSPGLAEEAIRSVPAHLAVPLLREAIWSLSTGQHPASAAAIVNIIANWPLPVLRFRDVLPQDLFQEEMSLDLVVFRGVVSRTKWCKMKMIDFRGFVLNWTFTKLVMVVWPLLSLKKSQRSISRLTKLVLQVAELEEENKLSSEIIPHIIRDMLAHEMMAHPRFHINMRRGEKMVVRLDRLDFTTQETSFMDYLVTTCLRSVTPVYVVASNIVIKSELNIGDEVLDSLAPFIVFRGQNQETLEGICLENLEDNIFFIASQGLKKFTHITSLALLNCNIALQEGRTRQRTSTRTQLASVLSCFENLVRLDLSQNCFAGCLPEVLQALKKPLEYLSLRECDLQDNDLEYLGQSRHAGSLRELNLSKICGLFPDDGFAVSTAALIRCLKLFPNVTVISISQNQITDNKLTELCAAVTNHWTRLKALNISNNILSADAVLQVVDACVRKGSMQFLSVPFAHNLMEDLDFMDQGQQRFRERLDNVLRGCNRQDVVVEVTTLAYAVFANWEW